MNIKGIRIVASYSCKRNCPFCYQKVKNGGFLSKINLEKTLDRFNTIIPEYITFQGGELSYYEHETNEIMKVVDDRFPNVHIKSLTTNGDGRLDFYSNLNKYGINNITFSINGFINTNLVNKLKKLKKTGMYKIRINTVLDVNNIKNLLDVLHFCIKNDFQLTICEDMRLQPNYSKSILEQELLDFEIIKEENQYNIYRLKERNYEFWVYKHQNHYDFDNLIILPDGTTTYDFDDVINCKGNFDA